MTLLRVDLNENGRVVRYEPPELESVTIRDETIRLTFNPAHSDQRGLTASLTDLLVLEAADGLPP